MHHTRSEILCRAVVVTAMIVKAEDVRAEVSEPL